MEYQEFLIRIAAVSITFMAAPLALRFLPRLFPYAPSDSSAQSQLLPELNQEYAKLEFRSAFIYLLFVFLCWYPCYCGLLWIRQYAVQQIGSDRYLMLPPREFFLLPAFFVGVIAGILPLDIFYRFRLRARYAEFILYGNLKYGFDGWRVIRAASLVTMTLAAITIFLALDSYARFTEEQIITNGFWGIGEQVRSYQQITKLKSVRLFKAQSGNIVESPHHVIYFNDGSIWSTHGTFYQAHDDSPLAIQKEEEIFKFIADKSHKTIEHSDLVEDETGHH